MTLGHQDWEIGPHLLHFEPPDILWAKYRGHISLEDAIRLVAVSQELGSVRPFFMVGDMTEAGLPEVEAGRYFSEHLRFEWHMGMIYVGTRLVQRATAKGIHLAAHLTEQTTDAEVMEKAHFVSTKEEACALIVRLRADASAGQLGSEKVGVEGEHP